MTVNEETRHELYEGLIEILGKQKAITLMEHLPPVGWSDVATKRDIAEMRAATKHDIAEMRAATKADIAELRHDIDEFRAATKHDIAELWGATRHDIAEVGHGLACFRQEVRGDMNLLRADFEKGLRENARTFFIAVLAANTTLAGFMLALTTLG